MALSIAVAVLVLLPSISQAAVSREQSLKSEISVGSYTNTTFIGTTVTSVAGTITSDTNFTDYSNTTVTSVNGNELSVSQNNGNINGSSIRVYNYTVRFNSTSTAIFDFVNSSYSYLNKLNFTLKESRGTFTYNGTTYPMIKVIATGGTESNSTGKDWWFSNQTVEYDPYSGIIFYQAVNTSVFLNNNDSNTKASSNLTATNVYMGPAAISSSNTRLYEEIGIGVAVAAAAASVIIVTSRNRKGR